MRNLVDIGSIEPKTAMVGRNKPHRSICGHQKVGIRGSLYTDSFKKIARCDNTNQFYDYISQIAKLREAFGV